MTPKTLAVGAVVAALLFSACGSKKNSATTSDSTTKAGTGRLAVYTVAPLKAIVTKIVTSYNTTHPTGQLKVVVETPAAMRKAVSTPSSKIAIDGASLKVPVKGARSGALGRDLVVIAVSSANPHHVSGLTAFAATSGLKTQVCGTRTTLGNSTALVLLKARITPNPSTLGYDCEATALADVASNKLDAVLMSRVGHTAPAGVKLIPVPDAQNILSPLSYAAIGTAPKVAAFEKFLATTAARTILTEGGYLP